MTTKTKAPSPATKKISAYLALVAEHPLASIRSESQLNAAQKVMDRLLAKDKLEAGEEMYLDALSDLVSAYEDVHYQIDAPSDADLLQHLMEAKGVTQSELNRQTGVPKSTISEILAGKKPFSRNLIRTFSEFFHVSANVLTANI